MKKLFLIVFLLGSFTPVQAKSFEGLSLGIRGGYTNYHTFAQEIFWQANMKLAKRIPIAPKIGYNHYPFQADFQGNQIASHGMGIFAEATVYPFVKP
ncbi:MAG: hypothetical protein LBS03_07065 [Bacteroidales bacterium]|nr:hypothetical protein [Bacteroidales bacterium]